MRKPIRRVGVVGAGVMGSGIAAHVANAGVNVVLLDLVPPDLPEAERTLPKARNRLATQGLDRALTSRPPALFHPSLARLIEVGNTEDDFHRLASCDLVIEAIVEKLEPKRALLAGLNAVAEHAILASNTSGIRIAEMALGQSDAFAKRFLVMHFFNPVRYMKLLELVAGPQTDPEVLARVRAFGEDVLGKGVVLAKDTPNFVGNRIGAHALLTAIHAMLSDGWTIEDVDAVTGPVMGRPKSATFRTADLVGIDTLVHVAGNCFDALRNDEDHDVFQVPALVNEMVRRGLLGDKSKSGFWRKVGDTTFETFDVSRLAYRPASPDAEIAKRLKQLEKLPLADRLRALVDNPGRAGALATKLLARSLAYAARSDPARGIRQRAGQELRCKRTRRPGLSTSARSRSARGTFSSCFSLLAISASGAAGRSEPADVKRFEGRVPHLAPNPLFDLSPSNPRRTISFTSAGTWNTSWSSSLRSARSSCQRHGRACRCQRDPPFGRWCSSDGP